MEIEDNKWAYDGKPREMMVPVCVAKTNEIPKNKQKWGKRFMLFRGRIFELCGIITDRPDKDFPLIAHCIKRGDRLRIMKIIEPPPIETQEEGGEKTESKKCPRP